MLKYIQIELSDWRPLKKPKGDFMKKEVILDALKNAGVEIEEAKLKEFITAINVANDGDIQKFKTQQSTLEDEKRKLEEQLKQKDDELAKFNQSEIDELRKYKSDNEALILQNKQTDVLKKFLADNKYSSDDILLNFIKNKLNPEFDNENKITNGDALLTELNNQAALYKIQESTSGAKSTPPPNDNKGEETDPFILGFKGEK